MELSRQADYAVRAMVDLAGPAPELRVQTRDIARRQQIPNAFLPRIIASLSRAQLIHTYRGTGGGVTLARPASQISLLDIIQAIEGPIRLNRCTYEPGRCNRELFCRVHPVWGQAQDHMNQLLGGTKLADLVNAPSEVKRVEIVPHGSPDLVPARIIRFGH